MTRVHASDGSLADDLRGKTVAVTAGTNTALFVNKMNNEEKLGMTIMSGKDHAESFLLAETGRVSAWMEDDILIAGFRANAKNPRISGCSTRPIHPTPTR